MPPIEEHIKLSLKRTGRGFREVHEWMDGKNVSYKDKVARHNIMNIPDFMPVVEKEFGKDGVREYLQHIKDDYENHIVLKIFNKLKRFKFWCNNKIKNGKKKNNQNQ